MQQQVELNIGNLRFKQIAGRNLGAHLGITEGVASEGALGVASSQGRGPQGFSLLPRENFFCVSECYQLTVSHLRSILELRIPFGDSLAKCQVTDVARGVCLFSPVTRHVVRSASESSSRSRKSSLGPVSSPLFSSWNSQTGWFLSLLLSDSLFTTHFPSGQFVFPLYPKELQGGKLIKPI